VVVDREKVFSEKRENPQRESRGLPSQKKSQVASLIEMTLRIFFFSGSPYLFRWQRYSGPF